MTARDRIRITGIRGRGFHGVLTHERRDGQEFIVDVVLAVDMTAAALTDDLVDTIDYGTVAQRVHDDITGDPCDLIETLAVRIAHTCLRDSRVASVEVTVHKPSAPIAVPFADVSVCVSRMRVQRAAFSIGANLGDRAAALRAAIRGLSRVGTAMTVSDAYETDPVGGPEQPAYLNAVVTLDTDRSPHDLLAIAHALENDLGRTREVRWGARTLDIDLLAVGDRIIVDDLLTLPHPRAHERGFVLIPWAQADPSAYLPGRGAVVDLAARIGSDGVRRSDLDLTESEATR
jgi:dihydroneopterin aldolase/2-amino-4-hydroxy-6-hydroxymethyldihydropteridine diphosphokinase